MPVTTDTTGYESPTAQGSRYVNLQWSICGTSACAQGQDRNVRRRIRRKARLCTNDVLQLGVGNQDSRNGQIARNCGGVWDFNSDSTSQRVITDRFSPIAIRQSREKQKNSENFLLLFFKDKTRFLENSFAKYPLSGDFPIDISPNRGYNTACQNKRPFENHEYPLLHVFYTFDCFDRLDLAKGKSGLFYLPLTRQNLFNFT